MAKGGNMATGTLTINEGAGPFHYGDVLTFTATTSHMTGGYPMVEVALFQDTDGDGLVMDLFGVDLVGVALNHPDRPVTLPPGDGTDTSIAARGWARLMRYAWKGGKESIDELDRIEFDVVV